jgi:hypothetical protein
MPRNQPHLILAPFVIVVLVGMVWWFAVSNSKNRNSSKQSEPTASPPARREDSSLTASPEEIARRRLLGAATALEASTQPADARQLLSELRNSLSALPGAKASKLISQLLESRTDAPTRLGFTIGSDGLLEESPSLRVFLLDQQARIDPAAAGAYAEKVLNEMTSPDEFAVALRNYARANTAEEGRRFLEQKLDAMLRRDEWRQDPSAGFLEAFDVAVHVGGTNLMRDLTALVRDKQNRAVSHAAYLALDRLVIADPASTLNLLQADPSLMHGREVTRANYFARADPGHAPQRQVLEKYLLNSPLDGKELETFVGLFPNANYMVSRNLLTPTATPDYTTQLQRDRTALQTVDEWIADSRFERLKPQLVKMRNRLETFIRQADGAN